jgi:hypothetical protein
MLLTSLATCAAGDPVPLAMHLNTPQDVLTTPVDDEGGPRVRVCEGKLKLHNRTVKDLQVILYFSETTYSIYEVKAGETREIGPFLCASYLAIPTDGQSRGPVANGVEAKPNKSYDLTWSAEKKQYVVDLSQQQEGGRHR